MTRPEKYTTHVKPHLEEIAAWRKEGMKLSAIAEKLNIAPSRLYEYQRDNQELKECLTTAQKELHADMVILAEDSLKAKLKDRYEVVEEIESSFIDKQGNLVVTSSQKKRLILADTTALIFTLKNRDPENWKDRTELGVSGAINVIPQPLAPVRQQDILEAEVLEIESPDEAD